MSAPGRGGGPSRSPERHEAEPAPEVEVRRSLEVPVAGVGGRSAGSPRAWATTAALAGGLAVVVAIGVLGGAPSRSQEDAPSPPLGGLIIPDPPPVASSTPTASGPTRAPARSHRPESLPDLPSEVLTGAPVPVFHRREGDDLVRLGWLQTPAGLRPLPGFPGALGGFGRGATLVAVASPGGELLVVRGLAAGGGPGDPVRIVDAAGTELWSLASAAAVPIAPIWSPDGTRVVVPGAGAGSWRVLRFAGGRLAADVAVSPGVSPEATPSPRPTGLTSRAQVEPVSFSRDSRWLYAAETRFDGGFRPVARIEAETGRVEPIGAFPVRGGAAPDAQGRTGPEVDPATGRRAKAPGLLMAGDRTTIRVVEPDGRPAFDVEAAGVLGIGWAGDGQLLVLESDRAAAPTWVRLVPVGSDGVRGEPLLVTGPLAWASLVGVRDGHALLAFVTGGGDRGTMLAMLRLADGATATLAVDPTTFASLQVGGWASSPAVSARAGTAP